MDSTQVRTGDDMLTLLATIKPENRGLALAIYSTRKLREAADLCGVDSIDMTKRQCITAILENF